MGQTTKYGLPYPESIAALRDGFAAIKLLAEKVEAALLPPLLATDGDGALAWGGDKVAEVEWDVTDNPDRRRGTWDSPGNKERLVIPSLTGWYLVQTSVTFTGKAEPDVYDVQIRTRTNAGDVGQGTVWGRFKVDVPNTSSDDSVIGLASLVQLKDTTPRTGIAVRVSYKGSTVPPATTPGQNKLRIMRMCAL